MGKRHFFKKSFIYALRSVLSIFSSISFSLSAPQLGLRASHLLQLKLINGEEKAR